MWNFKGFDEYTFFGKRINTNNLSKRFVYTYTHRHTNTGQADMNTIHPGQQKVTSLGVSAH